MGAVDIYDIADAYARLTDRCIYLTGKAGSGKTTFLRNLRMHTKKQIVVAAPTGVAAINAEGTTLHSLFQLPLSPFIPTEEMRKNLIGSIKMRAERRRVLYEMDVLVIDEISMVRADVLDMVDTLLRHFRYRRDVPFGGVQVIFIGDMYQLPPVVQEDEWRMLSPYYKGVYFFNSKVYAQIQPVHIELDKIFRQSDRLFIDILNEVRNNSLSQASLERLNSLYQPQYVNRDEDYHIVLTTHNAKADAMNERKLAELKGREQHYMAKVEGDFAERNYPTENDLCLKVGARVMFVKNDEEVPRRFYNGKMGVVEELGDDCVMVACDEGESIRVYPMVWRNVRYESDERTRMITETELGTFTQLPLRLAWAITIHKSQGLTFDKVLIDAEAAFASGQVYVALSRCRSLDGLVLMTRLNGNSLGNDWQILDFEKTKTPVDNLENMLDKDKTHYRIHLYCSLFDFRSLHSQLGHLQSFIKEHEGKLTGVDEEFLKSFSLAVDALQSVGDSFKKQIVSLSGEQNFLQQRLKAAASYFCERIDGMLAGMRPPFYTDNKAISREADEVMGNIYATLQRKKRMIRNVGDNMGMESYFEAKNRLLPVWNKSSYASEQEEGENREVHYEGLFRQLLRHRAAVAKENGLPIYMVVSTAALIAISNALPLDKKDLLSIKGVGRKKVEQYGDVWLEMVAEYCSRHGLENKAVRQQEERQAQAKAQKTKKRQKGDSWRMTVEMYKTGKSISDIAAERMLKYATIAGHLIDGVRADILNMSDLVENERLSEALNVCDSYTDKQEIAEKLSDILTHEELLLFCKWKNIPLYNHP